MIRINIMQKINFWDAHTHIHFRNYDEDREKTLERAFSAGVKMITVGTQSSTSEGAIELAKKYPGQVFAAVGFHPSHFGSEWHHDENEQEDPMPELFDKDKIKELARAPEAVAIGECGLDYYRISDDETKERQRAGFIEHVYVSHEIGKPLMIHCREAFGDLIEILEAHRDYLLEYPGVIHFFSGTPEEADALLSLGFSFTFGGVITFTRDYDEAIKFLPLENILSETDAPYVAPAPYRGRRNEPSFVIEVVKKLAELKSVSLEEMASAIENNVRRIFKV